MRAVKVLLMAVMLAALAVIVGNEALASSHTPTVDTYTDRNHASDNYGSNAILLLSASNAAGCVETTYLWFRFDVPPGDAITTATLMLTFESAGAGTTDLELRSSPDVSWGEMSLTWNNQPGLDTPELAAVSGARAGSIITFTSAALTSYMNAHRGQPVSLVVRADCSGSVSTSVALALRAREAASGSGASLELLRGPTAVTLHTLTARNGGSITFPVTMAGLLGAVIIWAWKCRQRASPN